MKKIFLFAIKFFIAALIIGYLIYSHKDNFLNSIKNFNVWWLLPAVLCVVVQLFLGGWRWYVLLRIIGCNNISLAGIETMTMKSFFCSLVIPGGSIGGDVAKLGFITKDTPEGKKAEAALSIVIDRLVGMVALFGLAIVLIVMAIPLLLKVDLSKLGIGKDMNMFFIICVIAGCALCILLAMAIFFHRWFDKIGWVRKIFEKLDKISHGLIFRLKAAIDLYMHDWRKLLFLALFSVIFIHLAYVPAMWCLAAGLNIGVPSQLVLVTAVILGNLAGLLPLTPSGIGLRDLVICAILQAGMFTDVAALPILLSMTILLSNLSGGFFFLFDFKSKI